MAGLPRPPADFAKQVLGIIPWSPADLLRVTRFHTGEPHFGKSGGYRFDDPRSRPKFGVMYAGESLVVAIGESVLHDAVLVGGYYDVAYEEIFGRYVWKFGGAALRLADLTGVALKALGVDARLTTA